jgi:PKD repeat protein
VTVDFGDGSTNFDNSGSAPAPVPHSYTHAGHYTAKITTVDPMGNLAQGATSQFTIGSPPTASFSISALSAATGVPLNFNGNGSGDPDAGVTLSSYAFNFADGGTAGGPTATHTYSKPGSYNVTLAVTNSLGLSSSSSQTVTIVPATISKLKVKHKTGKGAIIVVTVNAPGKLSGVGKSANASGPGTVHLKLKLSRGQLRQLATTGQLTVRLKIKFTPLAGQSFTKTIKIKFGTQVVHAFPGFDF